MQHSRAQPHGFAANLYPQIENKIPTGKQWRALLPKTADKNRLQRLSGTRIEKTIIFTNDNRERAAHEAVKVRQDDNKKDDDTKVNEAKGRHADAPKIKIKPIPVEAGPQTPNVLPRKEGIPIITG